MPLSVVVGGQFGSEGKGKVAYKIACEKNAAAVVRVGGTNSGHTAVDDRGNVRALRQLPASVLAPNTLAVLPPGALVDPKIFLDEVALLGLAPDRIALSPFASVISSEDREVEHSSGLIDEIGSTGSGTGAALIRRIGRRAGTLLASHYDELKPFLRDTSALMRGFLDQGRWIVIEGSQGFGLSLLHGGYYPHATSRDTSAAAFVGEAGLSPLDVREVILVLRAHPIRVAGNSGPLENETNWKDVAQGAGLPSDYQELTTATRKVRRVGLFEANIVRRAIEVNQPTAIVLNHFDYVDPAIRENGISVKAIASLRKIEADIGRQVDFIGAGPNSLIQRNAIGNGANLPSSKYSRQSD
jgi:adenylosuccinate synthase